MASPDATGTNADSSVSVIIPAYRAASHIAGAIDSVLAQTRPAHEIIVVNDGSPDAAELEQSLAPYGNRLVYITQQNAGAAAARNAGLRHATGTYAALLDADDIWAPEFVADQVAFLERTGFDMVYADAAIEGDPFAAGRTYMDLLPSRGEVSVRSLLLRTCNVLTSTVVARRSVLLSAGLFDSSLRMAEDYDFWLRLAHQGARIGFQRRVLATRRSRADSTSADDIALFRGVLAVYHKNSALELSDAERTAMLHATRLTEGALALRVAKQELYRGDFAAAISGVRAANQVFDRWKLRLALFGLDLTPRLMRWIHRRRVLADDALRSGGQPTRVQSSEPEPRPRAVPGESST